MEYRYDNVAITNLPVVATKISRAIGIMPAGLSDSGDSTIVMFTNALTAPQKASLDTLMAGTNLDALPVTTNTVYTLTDIEGVKAATGLDFDIYPTPNGLVIQFQKILTSQEKNSFRGAVANLLVITQG